MINNKLTRSAGTVEFAEDFSPMLHKLEKVTSKTDSQIEANDTLALGIMASRVGIKKNMLITPGDFLNLDARTNFSPSDIYIALWASAYSKDQEISYKNALNILVEWLYKKSADYQKFVLGEVKFSEELFNFTEKDIALISIIQDFARSNSKEVALNLFKLKAFQAGTGCSFSEAVSVVFG